MAGSFPPTSDGSGVWSRTPILFSPPNPPSSQSLATSASSQRTPSLGLFHAPLDDPGLSDGSSSSSSMASSTPSFGLRTPFPGHDVEVERLLHDVEAFPDEYLRARAHAHLAVLRHPSFAEYNIPAWATRLDWYPDFSVYSLFMSMFYTPRCVPNLNTRYVSAIICACGPADAEKPTDSDARTQHEARVLLSERLSSLAYSVVGWFLWPFYRHASGSVMPGAQLGDCDNAVTPTLDLTADLVTEGMPATRGKSMKDWLSLRDGYSCVLGNHRDKTWPFFSAQGRVYDPQINAVRRVYGPDPIQSQLHAAHIFKRSVAVLESNSGRSSDHIKSRVMTLDILRNYCRLDDRVLASLGSMDEPWNGMLLSSDAHDAFDEFAWCLMATETPNLYNVKRFDIERGTHYSGSQYFKPQVYFQDHSLGVRPPPHPNITHPPVVLGSSSRQLRGQKRTFSEMQEERGRESGIPLPNPELLRLHAALAHIMNLSGAAGLFDKMVQGGGAGGPAVPSADGVSFDKDMLPYLHESFTSLEIR